MNEAPITSPPDRRARLFVFAVCAAVIYTANMLMPRVLVDHPDLVTFSLLADLCVWVPAAYWWFLARPGLWSHAGILWLTYLGIAVTYHLAPVTPVPIALLVRYYPMVIGALAVVTATTMLVRTSTAIRATRSLEGEQRVSEVAHRVAGRRGRLGALLESEWLTWYYALYGWRRPVAPPPQGRAFSYHVNSGATGMLLGLAVFCLPEIPIFHLVLAQFNETAAWIFTAVSLYSIAMGPGQAYAMVHRPVVIAEQELQLRYGLLWEVAVPVSEIDSVEKLDWTYQAPHTRRRLRGGFFGQANVLVTFRSDQRARLVYGMERTVDSAALFLDQPDAFVVELKKRMG